MKYDVVVMGSINMDTVIYVDKFPSHGDNVVTKGSQILAGGKGANQAVTVAKQGVNHAFIGAVGTDGAANQIIEVLENKGVDVEHIIRKDHSQTGSSVAIVDKKGENTIFGMLAVNMEIAAEDIRKVFEDIEGTVFLLQLETSKASVLEALKIAKSKGMFIILDPAPEGLFFEEALEFADIVTPNRMETKRITGVDVTDVSSGKNAARIIANKGVKHVIVKLGALGSIYLNANTDEYTFVESLKVETVNTVGAGDTFAGVLASELSKNRKDIISAIHLATKAAAIKVSRAGGQDSIPSSEELKKL
ncbi:ribokinase [Streptococcus sp. H49]|uniref:ribokinase n=1 Tax=Streptococcus huangxiaojuni TaxID=3237239 RepID=UPI0034A4F1F2